MRRAWIDASRAFGGHPAALLAWPLVGALTGIASVVLVDPDPGWPKALLNALGGAVGALWAGLAMFGWFLAVAAGRLDEERAVEVEHERAKRQDAERRLASELDIKGQEELMHAIRSHLANDLDAMVVEGSQLIRDIPAGKVRGVDLDDALGRWSLKVRNILVRSYGIHNAWRPMHEVPGVFSTNPHEQARRVMEERHRRLLEIVQRCERGSVNPLYPALLLPIAGTASDEEGGGENAE